MPNIRQIKRRIKSVQNTAKITNAMSMIAASKMRRAQQRGIQGRPYAERILGVMGNLMAAIQTGEAPHPLLAQREVKRIGYIHITADRGLCGPLNGNMNRAGHEFLNQQAAPVTVIAVGRRGRDFMARTRRELRAVFMDLGDSPSLLDTLPISRVVVEDYINGEYDQVYIGYSDFISTLTQRPVINRLIPVEPAHVAPLFNVDYIYEPSPQDVLSELLPRYIEMQVFHAILEHLASEQSARMVSMRNASENAKDMISSLTLTYNKARQEMITKEILDLVGGAAALEG
jgi:F-type H+-transporting ATPase subunit gamma